MAPALPDLVSGRVQAAFCDVPTAVNFLNTAPFNVLAVTPPTRLARFPDVPTLKELGIRCHEVTWQALVAPAGTPTPVIERLGSVVTAALGTDAGRQALESLDLTVDARPGRPDDPFLADLIDEWRGWVRDAAIQPE